MRCKPTKEFIRRGVCSRSQGNEYGESTKMANLAFKGFLVHAHGGGDVPMSDADDGRPYALHVHTRVLHECVRL